MKQKYTLKIADMEIDVISDAAPESIHQIVGMLDRRIREILLKSHTCSKNEASLLCALSYCSDLMAVSEQNRELSDKLNDEITSNEILKSKIAELEAKLEVAEKCTEPAKAEEAPESIAEPEPAETAPVIDEVKPEEPMPRKIKSKSKVGTMFDLLSFTDV